MHLSWRLPVLGAVLFVSLGAGVAAAQAVIVRKAPPAAPVEVALNAEKVASGTADPNGDATLAFKLPETDGNSGIDANVFVDYCDTLRRVVIVERGKLPLPADAGCARRQISGLFWVRRVNTLVVDAGGVTPTLLLIKGKYGLDEPVTRAWTPSPTGLVVFGGGGLMTFRDARLIACGNVTPCSGHDGGLGGYTAGATYWVKRYIGVEGSYIKPRKVTAQGNSDTFNFDSALDAHVVTIAGKVAAPIGPVRLYAKVGMNYHRATSTTSETIGTASQTFEMKTQGWGWLLGGGAEAWITPSVALYAEAGIARIKGADVSGGEGVIDDRLRSIVFGLRVHLGR
jgi:OmpA-like transmembrane domain.